MLYRKYYNSTLLYCTALCGDIHLAQDLVADAFVKAYLALPGETPTFQFWLLRVCKNLWYDYIRKKKPLLLSEIPENIPGFDTPETLYLAAERQRILWQAIYTLSPTDRELVTLHYFSQLNLQQIAALTGKSHAAVRQRLCRLRTKLRTHLEEEGYGF